MMTEAPVESRHRWFRFRLRLLLLIVVVITIPLAWKVNRVQNQQAVVAEVKRLPGGQRGVIYDYQSHLYRKGIQRERSGPQWLRDLLGDDFFDDVVGIMVLRGATDEMFSRIAKLPHLEILAVHSELVTDAGLKHLAGKTELTELNVTSSKITVQGLAYLAECKALTKLSLGNARLSDSQLEQVAVLKQVESLNLSSMPGITDKGLEWIATNLNVSRLGLSNMPITDAGLLHLYGMKQLSSFSLRQLGETVDGVGKLHRARPDLNINWNAQRRLEAGQRQF